MADGLGSVGQRLSNALGRLQQSETGQSGKPAQPLQQAAAGPLKSVMVNVKAQAAQAAMRASPDAAAAIQAGKQQQRRIQQKRCAYQRVSEV